MPRSFRGGTTSGDGRDGGLRQRALLEREMARYGHEVKLIEPQYVRPFVKRQKNDAADAEAIVITAQRPEMRFITPKAEEQQAQALLFRGRERLVHQRTELVNALRSVLYKFGHPTPPGLGHLKRIEAIIEAENSDLPRLQIGAQATQTDAARRLQTMPGIGPTSTLAVEAFAPPTQSRRRGQRRDGTPSSTTLIPQAWFADVLARIADMPHNQLGELNLWNWAPQAMREAA